MKGDPRINQELNKVLKSELTAINQYFLHARMCKNWGLEKLNDHEYGQSIRAMKNADDLIERILFLEGLPNLQDLGKLLIGEEPTEIFNGNYSMAQAQHRELVAAIGVCEAQQDYISRDILEEIQEHLEEQIDWLETQQELLNRLGKENFLQSHL